MSRVNFRNRPRHIRTDQEKEELIRDVAKATSEGRPRLHYMKEIGISDSWFRRMKQRYMAEHPDFNPAPPIKSKSGWSTDPEERKREMERRMAMRVPVVSLDTAAPDALKAALREYKRLPQREKKAWRDARHLAPAQMSQITRGVATRAIQERMLTTNGRPTTDTRLARLLEPVNVVPNTAPLIDSIPVTLNDAILAFQVYQDHLKEFVDRLVRMRGGR